MLLLAKDDREGQALDGVVTVNTDVEIIFKEEDVFFKQLHSWGNGDRTNYFFALFSDRLVSVYWLFVDKVPSDSDRVVGVLLKDDVARSSLVLKAHPEVGGNVCIQF